MSYKRRLNELKRYTIGVGHFGGLSDVQSEIINEYMKIQYPGNYIVEEYYNVQRMAFDLRLVFKDSEEEIMFILKYSYWNICL